MRLTILLVRHAEPVAQGTAGFDEFTRPLTAKGLRDAARLSEIYAAARIDAVYSSPYLRARQTVEPMAQARGLKIETVEDLRERLLAGVELGDWRSHFVRSWNDFDYAAAGGESSREAQARMVGVLEAMAARHAAGTVVLASHGNLIALALQASAPSVDYAFWESIPMPAVFALVREGKRWRWVKDSSGSGTS